MVWNLPCNIITESGRDCVKGLPDGKTGKYYWCDVLLLIGVASVVSDPPARPRHRTIGPLHCPQE